MIYILGIITGILICVSVILVSKTEHFIVIQKTIEKKILPEEQIQVGEIIDAREIDQLSKFNQGEISLEEYVQD